MHEVDTVIEKRQAHKRAAEEMKPHALYRPAPAKEAETELRQQDYQHYLLISSRSKRRYHSTSAATNSSFFKDRLFGMD